MKKLDSKHKAQFAILLIKLARNWKNDKNKDIPKSTTSALIYANLAEYVALSLINDIEKTINKNCPKIKINNNQKNNKQPTHLENSINYLKKFDFENQKEILALLENIKNERNNLFHNLLLISGKDIYHGSCIKNIQNQTDKLIKLWPSVSKKILE